MARLRSLSLSELSCTAAARTLSPSVLTDESTTAAIIGLTPGRTGAARAFRERRRRPPDRHRRAHRRDRDLEAPGRGTGGGRAGSNLSGDDQADRSVHGGETRPSMRMRGRTRSGGSARWGGARPGTSARTSRPRGSTVRGRRSASAGKSASASAGGERAALPVLQARHADGRPEVPEALRGRRAGPGAYLRIVEEGEVGAGDPIVRGERPRPRRHDRAVRRGPPRRLRGQAARSISDDGASGRTWACHRATCSSTGLRALCARVGGMIGWFDAASRCSPL